MRYNDRQFVVFDATEVGVFEINLDIGGVEADGSILIRIVSDAAQNIAFGSMRLFQVDTATNMFPAQSFGFEAVVTPRFPWKNICRKTPSSSGTQTEPTLTTAITFRQL
jgi:hypothetical protein